MGTVITRTGYCPQCAAENRPWKGNLFLVYGTYRGGYYVRVATRNGIKGYSPCLFILKRVGNTGYCEIETACCMHGCSVEYRHSKEEHKMVYGVRPDAWKSILMPISEWNALTTYRRDEQYFI